MEQINSIVKNPTIHENNSTLQSNEVKREENPLSIELTRLVESDLPAAINLYLNMINELTLDESVIRGWYE
jgi:hypothetical protein